MDDLAGQRVTVMGVGRFGGGIGVTRFLARAGADVLLTDRLGEPDLADTLAGRGSRPGVAGWTFPVRHPHPRG